jgi:hypothetical protein
MEILVDEASIIIVSIFIMGCEGKIIVSFIEMKGNMRTQIASKGKFNLNLGLRWPTTLSNTSLVKGE